MECTLFDADYLEMFYEQVDAIGRRWKRDDLTGSGVRRGPSGNAWRGINVTAKGRHWRVPPAELDTLDAAGKIQAEFLKTKYPEDFAGDRLLVIHTNRSGDIARGGEEEARRAAREVDLETSPVNAIVSVLMLREGWDVQNVTVIVGLRPYNAKANILPEQTLGRGLRLMFRGEGTGYVERVDVIGTRKFMELVEQLEKDEDLKLEQFELGKDHLVIQTIAPDPAKTDKDIGVPKLTPILVRKKTLAEEIAALNVSSFRCPPFPMKEGTAGEEFPV